MTKRVLTGLAFALLASGTAHAAAPVTGQWVPPEKDSVIEIAPCGAFVCGRIAKITAPTHKGPPVDENNPNPALRKRPILGLAILSGFKIDGKSWRGSIYDPRAGKTYKSFLQLQPNGQLKVQGCLGPFCRSMMWNRAR
jgi:uncharacterized protein (DUF2147 family)